MGNLISSFFSGLTESISKLFGSPLDFLSGKSCSSVCGSTWDFICYIENFCVANLLKLMMVLVLCYIVLLFFYLLHKVGIFKCIVHSLCRLVCACISCWFSFWKFCCTFLCFKLPKKIKRRRRRVREYYHFDSSGEYVDESFSPSMEVSSSSLSKRWRDYRGVQLRKSLRPRTHRTKVGIARDAVYRRNRSKHGHHATTMSMVHDIRVRHTSQFAHKDANYRRRVYNKSMKSF